MAKYKTEYDIDNDTKGVVSITDTDNNGTTDRVDQVNIYEIEKSTGNHSHTWWNEEKGAGYHGPKDSGDGSGK